MLLSPVLRKNKATVKSMPDGRGKKSTAADEGRCVKTIVLMRPRRRESGLAKIVEQEERT